MYLWGLIGAPLIFLFELSAAYALVPVACQRQEPVLIHLLIGGCLVITLLAMWLASRQLSYPAAGTTIQHRPVPFMSLVSTWVSVLSVLALIAQWVTVFFVPLCAG
jgi:hypothetical protein